MEVQASEERKEKRKSKGGIIIGVSKKIETSEYKEWSDNIVERKIRHKGKE